MKYTIIGDGRLAKHISHYFRLLGIPFQNWARRTHSFSQLEIYGQQSKSILLLISDSAISPFIENHPFLKTKKLIHMSGALSLKNVEGAHPLNTFGHDLYDLEVYLNTPFVLESGRLLFHELLPELQNPHHYIAAEKKALYHCLCTMSGNFTTILWQNIFQLFESQLKLPREILHPYLLQVEKNLITASQSSLTGPLARGDHEIMIRHLDALRTLPEQALYYAFLNYYRMTKESEPQNEYSSVEI